MSAKHLNLGIKGEEIALQYLIDKGYQILYNRWRFKHKEIDIIAKHFDFLVFVEVKTRSNDYFAQPEDSVHASKQKLLAEAAEAFIENYHDFKEIRFDIISIILKQDEHSVYHIENAFYPTNE
jgi:putative endonuclease